jgi:hypothetical protein
MRSTPAAHVMLMQNGLARSDAIATASRLRRSRTRRGAAGNESAVEASSGSRCRSAPGVRPKLARVAGCRASTGERRCETSIPPLQANSPVLLERSVRIWVGGRCDARVWRRPPARSLATLPRNSSIEVCNAFTMWHLKVALSELCSTRGFCPHEICRPSPRDLSGERVAEGRVRGCATCHHSSKLRIATPWRLRDPLIRLRHLLPPQKARGEKGNTGGTPGCRHRGRRSRVPSPAANDSIRFFSSGAPQAGVMRSG